MGMMQAFDSLARVFGPMLGGLLYAANRGYPYGVGLAIMVAAAALAFVVLPSERQGAAGANG
ncbi:hypothetical protein D3C86_2065340 [compost metagenome]